MNQQVVIIHGGDSFRTRREYLRSLRQWPVSLKTFLPRHGWKAKMPKELGRQFEVLLPQMPNKSNARYAEWKIWFERMIPFLHHRVILVGHSLGGMFLVKYLAEHTLPKKIRAIILIATPHNTTADIGDFKVPRSLRRLSRQTKTIYLIHSPDDPVVPFSDLSIYHRALPEAKIMIINKRQHFNQEKFPELVHLLKKLRN